MQVVHWLPRTELPFAAPSRPLLLIPVTSEVDTAAHEPAVVATVPVAARIERPRVDIPRPGTTARPAPKPVAEPEAVAVAPRLVPAPPPRFALQLLRAGACLILAELPTGEPFQTRDPAYLLLKDMLRAAGLPDSPQLVGEPVRWPLLQRGNLDQGPEAARDFVQGFVLARQEEAVCGCLWLVGLQAIRFAGDANAEDYNRELKLDGLGSAWAVPGLELLMEEPERKVAIWRAMRGLMPCWKNRT